MLNLLCYTLLEYNREMKLKKDKGIEYTRKGICSWPGTRSVPKSTEHNLGHPNPREIPKV